MLHAKDTAIFAEIDALRETQRRRKSKSLRNLPCTCGSGKKFKRCCGKAKGADQCPTQTNCGGI